MIVMVLYNYKAKNRIIIDSILLILFLTFFNSHILASEAFENPLVMNIFQNQGSALTKDINEIISWWNP